MQENITFIFARQAQQNSDAIKSVCKYLWTAAEDSGLKVLASASTPIDGDAPSQVILKVERDSQTLNVGYIIIYKAMSEAGMENLSHRISNLGVDSNVYTVDFE